MQLILSLSQVSNLNHKKWRIENKKARNLVAGFSPYYWHIICISRISPVDMLFLIADAATQPSELRI